MEDVSDDDDEVEEEVVPPPPPPPPPAAPTKPTYFMEAACKKFEVPESAVLFSAYKPVSVKDGPMMGCITSSNSPSVWTNSGCSWKNLVRVGYEIEGILYEGLFVSFVSEADPESSDSRFLRRLTSAPTKHFVTELSGLGEKSSTKYANLCAFNMDSPRLDPVAARFRMLSKEEAERLAIAFRCGARLKLHALSPLVLILCCGVGVVGANPNRRPQWPRSQCRRPPPPPSQATRRYRFRMAPSAPSRAPISRSI